MNIQNKNPIINRQIIKGDYRNQMILIGAQGIIKEREVSSDENVASITFCEKNRKIYVCIENLDCRRKRLEIQGNEDFSKIYRICFIS